VTARPSAPLVLAVAAAGTCGALARYGLAAAVPATGDELPIVTLAANLSGCLLLGLLAGRAPSPSWARPVLGTGLLGGWTTWSALAVETGGRLADAPLLALVYLLVSLLGGVALARAGLLLGER
jgi:CrcB protein